MRLSIYVNVIASISIVFLVSIHTKSIAKYKKAEHSLKILMVIDKFPHQCRPFINNQIKSLLDNGHDVFIKVSQTRERSSKIMPEELIMYDIENRIFYKKIPKDHRVFDIIYYQFGTEYKRAEIICKSVKADKIAVAFRGNDLSWAIKKNLHLYDQLFTDVDLLLPVCGFFKKRLIAMGVDPKKIAVVHSTIDCQKFSYKERQHDPTQKIIIVSTGRLMEKKGIEYGIRSIAQVYKKHKNIQYIIIGDGPLRKELEELVHAFKLQDVVILIGQKDNNEVAEILDAAHIFMQPSVTASYGDQEGIPNSTKEAMARGLPIISTLHAGIPELVEDGASGFLVRERDVDALSDRLDYLILHPELWVGMGKSGRKKVEQEHDIKRENKKINELFSQLCAK